jgi:hypothetical protein
MKPTILAIPAALLTAFTLTSAPVSAGQQSQEHSRRAATSGSGTETRGRAVDRAQPRGETTAPPREQNRSENVAPRGDQNRREAIVPRGREIVPGRVGGSRYEPRYEPSYQPRYEPRYTPRYGNAPRSYSRPYVFRPRFSIGFGIFAGYAVPYSYSYPYGAPVYGYAAPSGPVVVGPGSNVYGGIAFEITPDDADVYVDGVYAGHVSDFDGTVQPLTLAAGTHRIEIVAPGYQTLTFDVGVQPGQVIPYRGDLLRY